LGIPGVQHEEKTDEKPTTPNNNMKRL